ncbi:hypothetical protein TURU_130765 [Turdus rufiventris]|nr:hypothetical protein TURU_130765 [Turdus rufiventris]
MGGGIRIGINIGISSEIRTGIRTGINIGIRSGCAGRLCPLPAPPGTAAPGSPGGRPGGAAEARGHRGMRCACVRSVESGSEALRGRPYGSVPCPTKQW